MTVLGDNDGKDDGTWRVWSCISLSSPRHRLRGNLHITQVSLSSPLKGKDDLAMPSSLDFDDLAQPPNQDFRFKLQKC